eukprot:6207104-Pleurochrysis_carterae.AAC.5
MKQQPTNLSVSGIRPKASCQQSWLLMIELDVFDLFQLLIATISLINSRTSARPQWLCLACAHDSCAHA